MVDLQWTHFHGLGCVPPTNMTTTVHIVIDEHGLGLCVCTIHLVLGMPAQWTLQ